ncbi:NET domain [Sesbania bispinosa]|nr:NET domain [Sesbania bispinosa]
MPLKMHKLTSLRTLTDFIVSKNGPRFGDLEGLSNLKTLTISKLQNVAYAMDASNVKPKEKNVLDDLMLQWGNGDDGNGNDMEVLQSLEPHRGLKRLTVEYYGGATFPKIIIDGSFIICCASPFSMSNASRSMVASDKCERAGPDYFGYYSSEVVNLLSQDEDVFPVATQTSEIPQNKYGEGRKKNLVNHSDNFSGSLYSNGVGAGLSDFKKDRLRSLLRQSAFALSSEVDEVVDPVFATCHLQSRLRSKTHSLNHMAAASDVVQIPCKKLKASSSPSSVSLLPQTSEVNPQCSRKGDDSHLGTEIGLEKEDGKVGDDLQFLLKNDSTVVEEIVKKYSDELSGTLGYMEQRLEMLLDAVMLKCRDMTLGEKQQLQRLIQKLPAKNLARVVEIICRSRQVEEQSCDKIFVDLEKEDNATLWRLYYYVEAVEKAKTCPLLELLAPAVPRQQPCSHRRREVKKVEEGVAVGGDDGIAEGDVGGCVGQQGKPTTVGEGVVVVGDEGIGIGGSVAKEDGTGADAVDEEMAASGVEKGENASGAVRSDGDETSARTQNGSTSQGCELRSGKQVKRLVVPTQNRKYLKYVS